MKHYIADFETTGYQQYLIDGHTRVFMWAIASVENIKVVARGTSIDGLMNWCFTTRRDKTTTLYFHNLKFDGSFILNWLYNNGYKRVKNFSNDPNKEFRTLISDMGVWYGITLKIDKANYTIRVNINDSLKKIPLSVKRIAKAYGLPMSKGDFDYDMYRPLGYIPTADEWDYVDRDVLIVAHALNVKLKEGMTKMTLSSDAFNNFKEQFSKKQWGYMFPTLPLDMWADIRKAYRGGWVYANPKYIGQVLDNVRSYDVNSLYPYSMYDKKLPYGLPIMFQGKYKPHKYYDLYIQTIDVSFKVKDGYLPTIQSSSLGRHIDALFITDTDNEIIELSLTNIDLDMFLEHHDIYYIEYKYGYMFRSRTDMFNEYVTKWGNVKATSVGGMREIAKDMMNSLYGKFGTNPKVRDKHPIHVDGVLKFERGDETISEYTKYLPVAVFTTANARYIEIRACQKLFKYHVYSDTDSIKVMGLTHEEVAKILDIDDNRLGAFKYEALYKQFKMLKAKHYAYIMDESFGGDGKLNIVASGITDKVKEEIKNFGTFKVGFKTKSKLVQRQVKGGVVLIPTVHEIK